MVSKVLIGLFLVSLLVFSGCLKNSKPELCAEITDLQIKASCLYGVALDKKDATFCRQIQSVEEKDNCLFDLAQGNFFQSKPAKKFIAKNYGELCSNLETRESKDGCFYRTAITNQDSKLCFLIENGASKEGCLEDLEA